MLAVAEAVQVTLLVEVLAVVAQVVVVDGTNYSTNTGTAGTANTGGGGGGGGSNSGGTYCC
jgi:hypothetical protein